MELAKVTDALKQSLLAHLSPAVTAHVTRYLLIVFSVLVPLDNGADGSRQFSSPFQSVCRLIPVNSVSRKILSVKRVDVE